jgi:hypothetical protein
MSTPGPITDNLPVQRAEGRKPLPAAQQAEDG